MKCNLYNCGLPLFAVILIPISTGLLSCGDQLERTTTTKAQRAIATSNENTDAESGAKSVLGGRSSFQASRGVEKILAKHCYSCHGPDSQGVGNFADIADTESMVNRGVIFPGRPAAESRLLGRILDGTMPPSAAAKLTAEEIAVLTRWIENMPKNVAVAPYARPASEVCVEPENVGLPGRRIVPLTRTQMNHAVRDAFDINISLLDDLSENPVHNGFSNNAFLLKFDETAVQGQWRIAQKVANFVSQNFGDVCSNQSANKCVDRLLTSSVPRLYKRPLSAKERKDLKAIFTSASSSTDTTAGFKAFVSKLLMSPHFLYRTELGQKDGDRFKLTQHEIAAKLSFLFLDSIPTPALMKLAEENKLSNVAQIRQAAEILFKSPAGRRGMRKFFTEMFELTNLKDVSKGGQLGRVFNEQLRNDLLNESMLLVEDVLYKKNGSLNELFNSKHTFINNRLNNFYDFKMDGLNQRFTQVDSPIAERRGILTHGSFLSVQSSQIESDPIKRGRFIRERLFCQPLPEPPESGIPEIEEISADKTTRERFEQHTSVPACRGCHELIDPLGFGLENFDHVGKFRAVQNGTEVEVGGKVIRAGDVTTTFKKYSELSALLGDSRLVASCINQNFFRYASQRDETQKDSCSLQKVNEKTFKEKLSINEIILSTVVQDSFIYVK